MSDTDDNSNYNEMSFAGSSDGTPHVRRAGSATGSVESYTSNGGRRRQSSIASADSHRYEEESTNPLVAAVRKITRPLKHFWSQGAVEQRIVEVAGLFYLLAVPYQIGFERLPDMTEFHYTGFGVDLVLLLISLGNLIRGGIRGSQQVLVSSQGVKKSDTSRGKRSSVAALDVNANNHRAHLRRVAKHAQNDRKKFRRVELRRLVLLLPVDAGLWATGFWRLVPYLRLTRFFFALPHVALLLDNSERSQAMPFALTRSLRVIFIFCTIAHWLGCLFFMLSVAADAEYYVDAPWVKSTVRANGRTDVPSIDTYIRSLYWSFQTITTAGHADFVDEQTQTAQNWEVLSAIITMFIGQFTFIYMSANFTSLILRLQAKLEEYRFKLEGVDMYLKRNHVSKDVRKRVKRFFRQSLQSSGNDQQIVEKMPSTLRREVLQDIYMRTLRRVSLFFGLESAALHAICGLIRRSSFQPDEVLARQGEVVTEMFFLESGMVMVTTFHNQGGGDEMEAESDDSHSDDGAAEGSFPGIVRRASDTGTVASRMRLALAKERPQLAQVIDDARLREFPDQKKVDALVASNNAGAGPNGAANKYAAPTGSSNDDAGKTGPVDGADRHSAGSKDGSKEGSGPKDRDERVESVVGAVMCGAAFVFGILQEAQIEAMAQTNVLVMEKNDFKQLGKEFPDMIDRVQRNLTTALRDSESPLLMEIEKLQVKSQKQIATLADMFFAAQRGEVETVREALTVGEVDINETDFEGRSALHIAATAGRLSVVELLLEKKCAVLKVDVFGKTAIENAVSMSHLAVVKALRTAGASLEWNDARTAAALCETTSAAQIEKLKLLVSCGLKVDAADYDSRTCMHLAASVGNVKVIEFLLSQGAKVNLKDRWDGTPLRDALRHSHVGAAEMLHKHGATLLMDEATAASELCSLAEKGNLEVLKALLDCGCPINSADYDRRTCIHLAASEGNTRIVEFLAKQGADMNVKDRWGGTPLHDAIRSRNEQVAKLIFQNGGVLGYDDTTASGELCELAKQGRAESVQLMLECGCQVDAADYDSRTCLHLAASVGSLPICRVLLDHGASINAKDRWGGTPMRDAVREGRHEVAQLLRAHGGDLGYDETAAAGELCELAQKGSLELLKVLLDCGCSVNAADYDKRTCLHLAASEGNLHICQLLLERGANVNSQDRWGHTPLVDAVAKRRPEIAFALREAGGLLEYDEVQAAGELCEMAKNGHAESLLLLIQSGASVNAVDYDGRSALHLAASTGSQSICKLLLDQKADVNVTDRWGGTPLRDAVREGHLQTAKNLYESGGALQMPDLEMATVLNTFAREGKPEAISDFLAVGANVNAQDYNGRTPLHAASAGGHKAVAHMLLRSGAKPDLQDFWGNTPRSDSTRRLTTDTRSKEVVKELLGNLETQEWGDDLWGTKPD